MIQFTFREEDTPRFRLRSGVLFALLVLLLLLLFTAKTPLFQLSEEELAAMQALEAEQEREMTFRFMDSPEDDVTHDDAKFLSDADRIAKSQLEEQQPPENEDPISQGDTFELEKAQLAQPEQQPAIDAVPSPPQPEQEQAREEVAEALPEEPAEPEETEVEVKTEETPSEDRQEQEADEPALPDKGDLPTDPGAPKPYRPLSSKQKEEVRKRAQSEMNALSASRPASSQSTSQYHNPGGSSAPVTGMSVETSRSDLGAYLKILKQLIKGNWRIPNIARFEVSGVAVVYFKVDKSGKFSEARVVTPSGYEPLDTSALNAIINTYKAPPLPAHVEEEWIPLRFAFYYNMRPRY